MDRLRKSNCVHILARLEVETSKSCIMSGRRQLDWERDSVVEYDEEKKILVAGAGENAPVSRAVDVSEIARSWQRQSTRHGLESPLKFFLDGSRRTYKIADVPIGSRLMPLVAGQVGVGVCQRQDRRVRPYGQFRMRYVLAVPASLDVLGKDVRHNVAYFKTLCEKINGASTRLQLDDILGYTANADDDAEDRGIMAIQDYMMACEKTAVRDLVAQKQLSDESWLVKDGSLEYTKVDEANPLHYARVKNNYKHVIGLSKSFNPELMKLKGRKSASRVLAELKPFHRTPAIRYKSGYADGEFAIWYVRIREPRSVNQSPFDGIVKIEKLLVDRDEMAYGLESSEVDKISAWVVNERNPVCFGKDNRWANHIYPVYLTETFVKSKYMSAACFTHLF